MPLILFIPCTPFHPCPVRITQGHLANLFVGREADPQKIAMRFGRDPTWDAALERLRQQRRQWLASGSSAARVAAGHATAGTRQVRSQHGTAS